MDAPVAVIPSTLPHWKWAAVVYFATVRGWPYTLSYRLRAQLAKDGIRLGVVAAIEAGEHRR